MTDEKPEPPRARTFTWTDPMLGAQFGLSSSGLDYMRAMIAGQAQTGEIRCEGRVLHAGRRLATAEARVTDARGKLYGHATSACMIFPFNEA